MLKTVSKEDMYLIVARVKNEIALSKMNDQFSKDIMTICNEMEEFLDNMSALKCAVKLHDLVKEIHNHVHNF